MEDSVPVKIDRNKPDPYDLYLRLSAPPQPGALLESIDAGEVHNALVSEFKVPRVCSLGIANLRKNVIKAFGGEALQLSSQTYYCEIHVARGGVKQVRPYPPPHPQTAESHHTHKWPNPSPTHKVPNPAQDHIAIEKPSKMITTGCGAKLMVEILPQVRTRCAPAVKWAMDQSKASEEGTLIYFERVAARSQGETYQSVSTSLQKGLYDLCDTYGIAMAYRNGVQFDKTKTYFGFHNEVFLFPFFFCAPSSTLSTHRTPPPHAAPEERLRGRFQHQPQGHPADQAEPPRDDLRRQERVRLEGRLHQQEHDHLLRQVPQADPADLVLQARQGPHHPPPAGSSNQKKKNTLPK